MDPRFGSNGKGLTVNIGPVNALPRDRFGNPIVKGMHVIYDPEVSLVFEVVKPLLDPRAPSGAVQMILSVTFPMTVPGNQPILRLIGIGRAPQSGEETPEPPVIVEN